MVYIKTRFLGSSVGHIAVVAGEGTGGVDVCLRFGVDSGSPLLRGSLAEMRKARER